jgi:hypothetical protein
MTHNVAYSYAVILHKVEKGEWATLFYSKEDVTYFYNDTKLYIAHVIPVYDHITQKYSFLKAGLEYRGADWGTWQCVKAPNGNLYIISVRDISKQDFREEPDNRWSIKDKNYSNKEVYKLDIYNWNKNKVIYSMTYDVDEIPSLVPERSAYIIANSFVVTCRVRKDTIYIDLVNLINEQFNRITYSISDYLANVLKHYSSSVRNISKEDKKHTAEMIYSITS